MCKGARQGRDVAMPCLCEIGEFVFSHHHMGILGAGVELRSSGLAASALCAETSH